MTANMLPADAQFSAATDRLVAVVTGAWPPDPAELSAALSDWSRLLIERAGSQSLSTIRIVAADEVEKQLAAREAGGDAG